MKRNHNEAKSTERRVLETFLVIFVFVCILLASTLYIYYTSNSYYLDELSLSKDIHSLKAEMQEFTQNPKGVGYIEIKELFDGIHIMGVINNLIPGSSHGLHIYEYSDILLLNKTSIESRKYHNYLFKHYNPKHTKHSCPSNNPNEEFHVGDFGNIIADNHGQAKFSLIKKMNARSLSGRVIVVNKRKDSCKPDEEYDDASNIYAYGVLSVVRPLNKKEGYMSTGKDEKFMNEINSINQASTQRKLKEENDRKKREEEEEEKKKTQTSKKIETVFPVSPVKIELPNKESENLMNLNFPNKNQKEESSIVKPSTNSLFNFLPEIDSLQSVGASVNIDQDMIPKHKDLNENDETVKGPKLNFRKMKDIDTENTDEKYKKHKKRNKKLFNDYGYDNVNKHKNKKEEQEVLEDEKENESQVNKNMNVNEDEMAIPILTQLKNSFGSSDDNRDDNFKADVLDDQRDRNKDVENLFLNSNFKQIEKKNKIHLLNRRERLMNPFEINLLQTSHKNLLNNPPKPTVIQINKANNEKIHLIRSNNFNPFELIKFKESEIFDGLTNLKNITLSRNSTSATPHNHTLNYTLPFLNLTNPTNIPKILFTNFTLHKVSKPNNIIINNQTVHTSNGSLNNSSNLTSSETIKKMFENMDNHNVIQAKMNMKDNTKLFLSNLKKNLVKIDHIVNKF